MTDALLGRHAPVDRVAFGSAGARTAADLLRDAAAVADALPERVAARSLALLGVRRDVYACLAAVLGAWARGYEVLVPPADATREGFLRMAQRSDVGAVLHDTASSAALPIAAILAGAAAHRSLSDASCVIDGALHFAADEAAEGGAALRVTGAQLLREAGLFGRSLALPERAAYACSLLPSTRYAWAAGIFWPLLSGSAILRDDPRAPQWTEQLAHASRAGASHAAVHANARMRARDNVSAWGGDGASALGGDGASALGGERAQVVVVGAPAQLRLMVRDLVPGLRVVALGPPLVAAAFQQLRAAGLVVRDVYATRALGCLGQRAAAEHAFRALLELSLKVAGVDRVQVSGPHFADAHLDVSLAEGGFVPTGAAVQRAQWEEHIAWMPEVHDAALLALDASSTSASSAARTAARAALELCLAVSFKDVGEAHARDELACERDARDDQARETPARAGHAREGFALDERAREMPARAGHAREGFARNERAREELAREQAGGERAGRDRRARAERALRERIMAELPELDVREWRSLWLRDSAARAGTAPPSFASGRGDLTRTGAGRHDRASLLRLFGRAPDGAALSWELSVQGEQIAPERAVRQVRVPERYGYFAGHFPGYPLLPGAAQLSELVVPFARAVRPELGRLTRMARLKFQERIKPNDLIEVKLSFSSAPNAAEHSVDFTLQRGGSVCANGRLWFAAAAAPGREESAS